MSEQFKLAKKPGWLHDFESEQLLLQQLFSLFAFAPLLWWQLIGSLGGPGFDSSCSQYFERETIIYILLSFSISEMVLNGEKPDLSQLP